MVSEDARLKAMERAYDTMRDALICIMTTGDRHSAGAAKQALNRVKLNMSKIYN